MQSPEPEPLLAYDASEEKEVDRRSPEPGPEVLLAYEASGGVRRSLSFNVSSIIRELEERLQTTVSRLQSVASAHTLAAATGDEAAEVDRVDGPCETGGDSEGYSDSDGEAQGGEETSLSLDIAAAACNLLQLLSTPGGSSKLAFFEVVQKLEQASARHMEQIGVSEGADGEEVEEEAGLVDGEEEEGTRHMEQLGTSEGADGEEEEEEEEEEGLADLAANADSGPAALEAEVWTDAPEAASEAGELDAEVGPDVPPDMEEPIPAEEPTSGEPGEAEDVEEDAHSKLNTVDLQPSHYHTCVAITTCRRSW